MAQTFKVFGHHEKDGWIEASKTKPSPGAAKEFGFQEFKRKDGFTAFRVVDPKGGMTAKNYRINQDEAA